MTRTTHIRRHTDTAFLQVRHGSWWLRFRLPADVRASFGGQHEILANLGVSYSGREAEELQAGSLALAMAAQIKTRIAQARSATPTLVLTGQPAWAAGRIVFEKREPFMRPADGQHWPSIDLAPQSVTYGAPVVAASPVQPKLVQSAIPTFREAADAFLAAQPALIRKGERTQKRLDWYTGRLTKHILPHIGDTLVSEVDTAACDRLFEKRTRLGATVETHSQDVQLISQVLDYARDDMRVTAPIRMPKRVARPRTRRGAITEQQYPVLVDYLSRGSDQFLYALVRLMGATGMRSGEEKLLQLTDFGAYHRDGDATYINVPDGKVGRRDFHTLAGTELVDVLKLLRSIHPTPADPKALVFQADEYHHAFRDVLVALDKLHPDQGWLKDRDGNSLSLYSLRHMFITGMLVDGHSIDDVAMMCGTSPTQIRAHYSHVKPKQMWDRVRKPAA